MMFHDACMTSSGVGAHVKGDTPPSPLQQSAQGLNSSKYARARPAYRKKVAPTFLWGM